MSLLDIEYPNISQAERKKYQAFLNKRCSEYYFLGYLRCSKGDVGDAAAFYILDDNLRALLLRHIVRLEIQLKSDFVQTIEAATSSTSFWDDPQFYLPSSRLPAQGCQKSRFEMIRDEIRASLNRHQFSTPGPSNLRAAYFMSFGTFISLYQHIDLKYKQAFITKYTTFLPFHDFRTLFRYLQALRIVRNRCAHGNHIITKKTTYELQPQIKLVQPPLSPFAGYATPLEAVLLFILKTSNCAPEFRKALSDCLRKNNLILTQYPFLHSLSQNTFANLGL